MEDSIERSVTIPAPLLLDYCQNCKAGANKMGGETYMQSLPKI